MRIRTLAAAAGIGALLVLTGCVGGDPLPTLPPEPTSTPIFASEEEALAAAEEAYAAYSAASDLISSEGGVGPERIQPFVTLGQFERELETAEFFRSNGWRTIGSPLTTRFDLQQYNELLGSAEVIVYVCLDVSAVAVVDERGTDVTPTDREPVVPLEVLFLAGPDDVLLVASSEQWPGASFC
jgi:hypothetical protein